MLKSSSLPEPIRSLSTGQRLLLILASVVIAFLIIGSFNQSSSASEFSLGLHSQPFLVLAFLSFGGGLLSFVSPCTLPVLTAYFAFAFQSDRTRIATNTLAFMLGLGTTFTLFGAIGFALGRVLLQNQQLIILVGGAVILAFGVMSLLGKGFGGINTASGSGPQSGPQGGPQPVSATLGGSYLFGLTFAVGWSSCIGPILGSVLTLAAQTTSVWNGMMLLFIYTLGLGLPLLLVSTFFGRMNRNSLFWRLMKGKGWQWDTHMMAVALVWALAIWRILAAFGEYAFRRFDFLAGQQFTLGHEIGLLIVVLLGAAFWVFTSPGERRTTVHLHSTQLISGALFVLMGVLMLNGTLAGFNSLIPPDLAVWFITLEEKLIALFN